LIKVVFASLGGLAGLLIGGALLAMAGGTLASYLYGTFEGAAATGGGLLGGGIGAILGGAAGVWAVLRRNAHWAGSAVVWLWAGVLMLLVALGFVAFS
jgi:hypothetical protein